MYYIVECMDDGYEQNHKDRVVSVHNKIEVAVRKAQFSYESIISDNVVLRNRKIKKGDILVNCGGAMYTLEGMDREG